MKSSLIQENITREEQRKIMQRFGLGDLIVGTRLYLKHREHKELFAKLGFKKVKREEGKSHYFLNISNKMRIHVIHNKGGYYWHIDNHIKKII